MKFSSMPIIFIIGSQHCSNKSFDWFFYFLFIYLPNWENIKLLCLWRIDLPFGCISVRLEWKLQKSKIAGDLHYIHLEGSLIIQGLFGGLFATVEKVRPYMNKVLKFAHKD